MKVKQLFALSALAVAGSALLVNAASAAPATRAEVAQSVLAARAAGTLIPAGEGVAPGYPQADATASSQTRTQTKSDVLQARADGTLRHAGEAGPEERAPYQQALAAPSILTRAQVKAEVLEARAEGTLIPAGEAADYGSGPGTQAAHVVASAAQRSAARSAN